MGSNEKFPILRPLDQNFKSFKGFVNQVAKLVKTSVHVAVTSLSYEITA